MKRVLIVITILLPFFGFAQKQKSYTFDFSNASGLIPAIELPEEEYNGHEINVTDWTFRSPDDKVSISFEGRYPDGMGGFFTTGWPQEDGSFEHFLFLSRGSRFIISSNGADLESFVFEKSSFPGNLQLISPTGVGRMDAATFSWYSEGALGVTTLNYSCNGQNPKIREVTVSYLIPQDVLEPRNTIPLDKSDIHHLDEITFDFAKPVHLGEAASFVLNGPRGFNPVRMSAKVVGNKVVLSLPEDVTIDESNEASRGTYTLTVAEKSIITTDDDEFYNKKTTYYFNVVEAYYKFVNDILWPDMSDNVEKIDTIVLGFPGEVGKFEVDDLKLTDREGNIVRTMQAKWLVESEYTADRPFFKADRDIYKYVQFVFSGSKTAAIKTSGIYHITIPEKFIWNGRYDPTAEDEGISAGARFNPELVLEYNVNGVVYPSDEVFQAAQDLLAFTGAGYPAADSPSRLALQSLVDEGVGADELFEAAMDAFYAETVLEMPKSGYYLLSAVGSDGKEVYVGYENGKVSLTSDPEEAAHLLATVNEDGTLVFETPDHKFLKQMMPTGANVSDAKDKMNNLTFSRLVLQDEHGNDIYTPKQLFGLWSINGIIGTNDEEQDITAYTLVNLESLLFETNRDKSLRYFSATQTNAFRLTETDAPVPDAAYTFTPAAGSEMESLYYITLTFGDDVNGIKLVSSEGIVLKGTSTRQYTPTKITNTGRQFVFFFDDVAAGTYTLTIPKGAFTYTYNEKTVAVKAISVTYRVNNSAVFVEDFLYLHSTYYHNYPNIDTFVRDVDLNNFSMVIYDQGIYGLDTNKAVTITTMGGIDEYARGHLEFDNNFVDQYGTKMTHMVLVMDEPIKYGTLPAQTYCYNIYAGTFGDSNFAEWLKDPQNKRKGDCHVNAYLTPMISVDNDRGNMTFDPQPITSHITKLSDITITFPHFNVVDITEENNIDVLERYTGRTISTSVVRVEGKNNQFTFASDETLTADTNNGGYMIPIPLNFFKAGEYFFPAEREMELFYYAKGGADAIEGVEAAPQTGVIFDLSGRRVTNSSKPGIYIVNGRKVVVK